MAKQWYHQLGFSSNPFSIKPAAFENELVGYNLGEIFSRIETGDMLFIQGDYGSGKTTMLKQIISRFGGKKKVIYYNCSASNALDTKKLLLGRNFFSRAFKVLPSDMILLVDEAQQLKLNDSRDIMPYFASNIKSVVFLGAQYKKESFTKDMKKFLEGNVSVLNKLTPEQAVELVRRRIGSIQLLSDEIIKTVYHLSGLNPRLLLENCEDLCRYAVERGSGIVTDEHIKAVLQPKPVALKPAKKAKQPKQPAKRKQKAPKPKELRKKAAKSPKQRQKTQKPKIEIEEVEGDTSKRVGFEYNVNNIRTYEEEMATTKNE